METTNTDSLKEQLIAVDPEFRELAREHGRYLPRAQGARGDRGGGPGVPAVLQPQRAEVRGPRDQGPLLPAVAS